MIVAFLIWTAILVIAFVISIFTGKPDRISGTVNQEPTVMDLADFRESMKVKSPLTEEEKDWLNKMNGTTGAFVPKNKSLWKDMIEVGSKLKELDDIDLKFHDPIHEQLKPFYPLETDMDNSLPRYYIGPIQVSPDRTECLAKQQPAEYVIIDPEDTIGKNWTEFKEHNPELFNARKLENEYLNKPFVGYRTVLTGDIFNGVLFIEGPDDSVIQYSLRDNIPPNGRYVIHGVVEKMNILNVTEYQAVED